jgi:endonuclease/exonuclease/phosphatase family metal-dependent hydrolase
MEITFLTYNTLYNRGLRGLKEIINKYQPDIICLQEVATDQKNLNQLESDIYKLADFSNYAIKKEGVFGIATFYNKQKLEFNNSNIIPLSKTILDFLLSLPKMLSSNPLKRNILKTVFKLKKINKKIIVFNTHLTVYGSNNTRIKQLKSVLNNLKVNKNTSAIIAGDFNYFPYGRKKLEEMMSNFGFKEATKKINYTIKYRNLKEFYYNFINRILVKLFSRFFSDRLKIDYIFYKNLNLINCQRIEIDYSDHYPIITKFRM